MRILSRSNYKKVDIDALKDENENFKLELKNYRNGFLATENELLKDEKNKQDNVLFSLIQENAAMEDHIKKLEEENIYLSNYNKLLEGANFNMYLTQTILENKVEELTDQLSIYEILETDKPLSNEENFKKKDDKLINTIEKVTDERDTYKNVINVMCDKFEIDHEKILNLIDDISQNKGEGIEKV